MWKPWIETHTARMKAQEQNKVKSSEDLGEPIRDGRSSRNRKREWLEASPDKKKARLRGFVEHHLRLKEKMRQRRENAEVVEVVRHEPIISKNNGKLGKLPGTKNFEFDYPPCPRCDGSIVKRAGIDRGVQRYKCHTCGRSFGSNTKVVVKTIPFHITCYRCGAEGVFRGFRIHKNNKLRRADQSGVEGYCSFCNKRFLQGGSEHLERSMCVLMERVDKEFAGRNDESTQLLKLELLQLASMDVITGLGYTWNVPLRVADARKVLASDSFETNEYRRKVKGENAYGTET